MATADATKKPSHAFKSRSAMSGRYMAPTLSDPDVAARLEAFLVQTETTPGGSVKFLKKVGILNRSGKLSKNFGG